MTKHQNSWIMYLMILVMIIPLVNTWAGPPPADIVFYGYATQNATNAPPGTTVSIRANGGTLMMDSDTVLAGGYYPTLQMTWDDPDTGGDEGITYADNAEAITFKVGDESTNYPQNVYVRSLRPCMCTHSCI